MAVPMWIQNATQILRLIIVDGHFNMNGPNPINIDNMVDITGIAHKNKSKHSLIS